MPEATHTSDRTSPWRRRPNPATPHAPVREDWLNRVVEEPFEPELPIVDSHHHLWDRQDARYLLEEFAEDVGTSGHNVVASVFVQCRTMLRADGPEAMRPVGEVEFVRGLAAQARSGFYGQTRITGIVGGANLLLGDAVGPVLDAMIEAGGGLLKGVRTPVASHSDPAVVSNPVPAPARLMESEAFRAGARRLQSRRLVLDLWAYQTQLGEIAALADHLPDLSIVVDHCGGPLGVGPYPGRGSAHRSVWAQAIGDLAKRENVSIKIGGFGMPIMGFDFHTREVPPTSAELAAAIEPDIAVCAEAFGPERILFESNFPVDKGAYSYGVWWNALKRLTAEWGDGERARVFAGSAREIYDLEDRSKHLKKEETSP